MEYVYPAIFHPNEDGSYTVTFPDLPGAVSEGKTLANAMHMAELALTQWVTFLIEENQDMPAASEISAVSGLTTGEFVNLIRADVKDTHAVRRTVSIPKWMDEEVTISGLSLSKVLQDALSQRLPHA